MFDLVVLTLAYTLVGVVALPVAVLAIEVLAACWPGTLSRVGLTAQGLRRRPGDPFLTAEHAVPSDPQVGSGATNATVNPPHDTPSVAVIIPAHNEESGLTATIRSLGRSGHVHDRIVVVADNCTDRTAEVARACGVDVLERHDTARRGKGYALAHAVAWLAEQATPPDIVAILDADCRASANFLTVVREAVGQTGRPVQTLNLSDAEPVSGPKQAVSVLAMRMINLVRPLGLTNLGGPCRLMGTGMAIPWSALAAVDLATGNLVEDLQLVLDLAVQGRTTTFRPAARVVTEMAPDERAFVTQRSRWEHGQLATLVRQAPRMLLAAVVQRRWDLLLLAADLTVPPLTLLAGGVLVVWVTTLAVALLTGLAGPLITSSVVATVFAASIGLAWAAYCRWQVSLRTLAAIPGFVFQKLPVYRRLLTGGTRTWVRTARRFAG